MKDNKDRNFEMESEEMDIAIADDGWFERLEEMERNILKEIDPDALKILDREKEELLADSDE